MLAAPSPHFPDKVPSPLCQTDCGPWSLGVLQFLEFVPSVASFWVSCFVTMYCQNCRLSRGHCFSSTCCCCGCWSHHCYLPHSPLPCVVAHWGKQPWYLPPAGMPRSRQELTGAVLQKIQQLQVAQSIRLTAPINYWPASKLGVYQKQVQQLG